MQSVFKNIYEKFLCSKKRNRILSQNPKNSKSKKSSSNKDLDYVLLTDVESENVENPRNKINEFSIQNRINKKLFYDLETQEEIENKISQKSIKQNFESKKNNSNYIDFSKCLTDCKTISKNSCQIALSSTKIEIINSEKDKNSRKPSIYQDNYNLCKQSEISLNKVNFSEFYYTPYEKIRNNNGFKIYQSEIKENELENNISLKKENKISEIYKYLFENNSSQDLKVTIPEEKIIEHINYSEKLYQKFSDLNFEKENNFDKNTFKNKIDLSDNKEKKYIVGDYYKKLKDFTNIKNDSKNYPNIHFDDLIFLTKNVEYESEETLSIINKILFDTETYKNDNLEEYENLLDNFKDFVINRHKNAPLRKKQTFNKIYFFNQSFVDNLDEIDYEQIFPSQNILKLNLEEFDRLLIPIFYKNNEENIEKKESFTNFFKNKRNSDSSINYADKKFNLKNKNEVTNTARENNLVLISLNLPLKKIIVYGYEKYCIYLDNKEKNNFNFSMKLGNDQKLFKNIENIKKFFDYYLNLKLKNQENHVNKNLSPLKFKNFSVNNNKPFDSEVSSDGDEVIKLREWKVKCGHYRISNEKDILNIPNSNKKEFFCSSLEKIKESKKINRKINFLEDQEMNFLNTEETFKFRDEEKKNISSLYKTLITPKDDINKMIDVTLDIDTNKNEILNKNIFNDKRKSSVDYEIQIDISEKNDFPNESINEKFTNYLKTEIKSNRNSKSEFSKYLKLHNHDNDYCQKPYQQQFSTRGKEEENRSSRISEDYEENIKIEINLELYEDKQKKCKDFFTEKNKKENERKNCFKQYSYDRIFIKNQIITEYKENKNSIIMLDREILMIDQMMYIFRVIDFISKKESIVYSEEDLDYLKIYYSLEILKNKKIIF